MPRDSNPALLLAINLTIARIARRRANCPGTRVPERASSLPPGALQKCRSAATANVAEPALEGTSGER
jgi:hypothetical protein